MQTVAQREQGTLPSSAAFTRHLLSRTTFAGPSLEALADVAAVGGPQRWLDDQLRADPRADAALDADLHARFPLAHASAPHNIATQSSGSWAPGQDLAQWTLAKNIWSRNQLFEVMTEFWSNHLNVHNPGGDSWATRGDFDAQVVRRHALGRFDDMLAASVVAPAMLQYLTNVRNHKRAPDENLGREVMELHSVGIAAGYGQTGVVDASRAFTGLSVYDEWNGGHPGNYGTLFANTGAHYVGPLRVLGWSSANRSAAGAVPVAQSLARYLAHHPATARHLAGKLAIRFVADNPPPSLVAHLAAVYTKAGTAIVPVLRALFASAEFAASAGRKFRRPVEDVAAAARGLGWTLDRTNRATTGLGDLSWALVGMGQQPLNWLAPNGYPDVAAAWVGTGTVLARWNAHSALAQGWYRAGIVRADPVAHFFPAGPPSSRTALVQGVLARLHPGVPADPAQVGALVTYLGGDGAVRPNDLRYQLPTIAALVLDAPTWSAR